MMEAAASPDILAITADIVSSFVSNNQVRSAELPDLVSTVHASLMKITTPVAAEEPVAELRPAVSVKKSMTDGYLICLDDGKKFQSLKRHLSSLGVTPDEYRTKWGLPRDYPMVAPGYAAKRSALAKSIGLGSMRGKAAAISKLEPSPVAKAVAKSTETTNAVAPESSEAAPAKRRGRTKKAA